MDASIDNSQTVWIATCSMCVCCYVQCRKWVHVQKGAVDIFLGDCFLFVATGNHCLCRPFIYKVLNTVELCYSRYRKKTWKKINKTHVKDIELCLIFRHQQWLEQMLKSVRYSLTCRMYNTQFVIDLNSMNKASTAATRQYAQQLLYHTASSDTCDILIP